jgi:hypothetical protein
MADIYNIPPKTNRNKKKHRSFSYELKFKSRSNGIYNKKSKKISGISFFVLNIFFVNFSDPIYVYKKDKEKKLPTFIFTDIYII